jgi:hypothetical protein
VGHSGSSVYPACGVSLGSLQYLDDGIHLDCGVCPGRTSPPPHDDCRALPPGLLGRNRTFSPVASEICRLLSRHRARAPSPLNVLLWCALNSCAPLPSDCGDSVSPV